MDKSKPLRNSVLGRDVADDVREEFEIGDVLGAGQFGVIRQATHRETQHKYAVKSIAKANLQPAEAAVIRLELQIMHHVAGVCVACWGVVCPSEGAEGAQAAAAAHAPISRCQSAITG